MSKGHGAAPLFCLRWLCYRLTSAGATLGTDGGYAAQSYSYDSYGRLLNGSKGNGYTYNTSHKHAVTTAGGTSYTFGYDAEIRLVSVSGTATASFLYDGDNKPRQRDRGRRDHGLHRQLLRSCGHYRQEVLLRG
ncbi:MAG TPA: hypothetical protein P5121_04205 [Caldilineaceae bacterium]|nr:hypothetical protein [Caldilineaceae bacterium]